MLFGFLAVFPEKAGLKLFDMLTMASIPPFIIAAVLLPIIFAGPRRMMPPSFMSSTQQATLSLLWVAGITLIAFTAMFATSANFVRLAFLFAIRPLCDDLLSFALLFRPLSVFQLLISTGRVLPFGIASVISIDWAMETIAIISNHPAKEVIPNVTIIIAAIIFSLHGVLTRRFSIVQGVRYPIRALHHTHTIAFNIISRKHLRCTAKTAGRVDRMFNAPISDGEAVLPTKPIALASRLHDVLFLLPILAIVRTVATFIAPDEFPAMQLPAMQVATLAPIAVISGLLLIAPMLAVAVFRDTDQGPLSSWAAMVVPCLVVALLRRDLASLRPEHIMGILTLFLAMVARSTQDSQIVEHRIKAARRVVDNSVQLAACPPHIATAKTEFFTHHPEFDADKARAMYMLGSYCRPNACHVDAQPIAAHQLRAIVCRLVKLPKLWQQDVLGLFIADQLKAARWEVKRRGLMPPDETESVDGASGTDHEGEGEAYSPETDTLRSCLTLTDVTDMSEGEVTPPGVEAGTSPITSPTPGDDDSGSSVTSLGSPSPTPSPDPAHRPMTRGEIKARMDTAQVQDREPAALTVMTVASGNAIISQGTGTSSEAGAGSGDLDPSLQDLIQQLEGKKKHRRSKERDRGGGSRGRHKRDKDRGHRGGGGSRRRSRRSTPAPPAPAAPYPMPWPVMGWPQSAAPPANVPSSAPSVSEYAASEPRRPPPRHRPLSIPLPSSIVDSVESSPEPVPDEVPEASPDMLPPRVMSNMGVTVEITTP